MMETLTVVGLHELQVLRRPKRLSVIDARRSGWPTTAVRGCFLRNDRRITTRNLVTELSVCKGSVYNSTDVLGYSKASARWVARSVTGYHKTVREEVCSDLPSGYEAHSESFMSWIVTGDKTWVHHFEPQTKGRSVEWHHPTSWKRKFMATPSAGNVMELWSLFWKQKG